MTGHESIGLLTAVVRQDWPAARHCVTAGAFDFAFFESFIARNQLSGYLYSALMSSPAAEWFPEQTLAQLERRYLGQKKRNAALAHEARRLQEVFGARGEQFILLKGVYLAARFYGAADRRALWDIDILIRKERLQPVQRLLRDDGYVRKSGTFLREDLSRYFTHAFDFAKGDICLDVHWSLSTHSSYRLDYAAIWDRKQSFCVEDRVFLILPDEYEIVFNLLSTFRDLERGSLRLRSMVDLYMILKGLEGHLDWQHFFAHRKRENIWKISLSILSLFLSVFQCGPDFPELARAIEHQKRTGRFDDRDAGAKLLEPSWFAARQKAWAARQYGTSVGGFFFWWMISLPFRLSVYKPGEFSALGRNMLARVKKMCSTP